MSEGGEEQPAIADEAPAPAELTEIDVYGRLRKQVREAGGESRFAHQHSLSMGYLHDVMAGRSTPGPMILAVLGLRKVVRYVESRSGAVPP